MSKFTEQDAIEVFHNLWETLGRRYVDRGTVDKYFYDELDEICRIYEYNDLLQQAFIKAHIKAGWPWDIFDGSNINKFLAKLGFKDDKSEQIEALTKMVRALEEQNEILQERLSGKKKSFTGFHGYV